MGSIIKRNYKTETNKPSDRWFTITLPEATFNYIALFINAYSVTKRSIVLNSIKHWMEESLIDDPPEKLVDMLCLRSLEAWKITKAKNPELQIRKFREQLIYELEWKGLTEEQIKIILIAFNNGTR